MASEMPASGGGATGTISAADGGASSAGAADAFDAVGSVRASTARVAASATHVTIDDDALAACAAKLVDQGLPDISWSTGGFHFDADAAEGGPLTCQYVFVVDCLNFCFWPQPGMEYEHLAGGLRAALVEDSEALSAKRLMETDEATVRKWLHPFEMPQMAERVRKVREVGTVLDAEFGGLAIEMVRQAKQSAPALVDLVTRYFPGFRDHTVYKGEQVFLYKRAQILVGDLWAAYGQQTAGGESPFAFRGMERLTMFADYRVPQILREYGVLAYSDGLAADVDAKTEIPVNSEQEIEIRAATVVAVERLRAGLADAGHPMLAVQVDWLLWNLGEARRDSLPPHHRTLTVFY